jgi:CheY-like chemotaxis protein
MPKTLLLADDSVVIQKLVGLSFANQDVEIVATDNGDDAISMAREVVPDVVLADVVMPGSSGYDVCAAIKQDPALAHVPVLLLTGTFEAFDENRAESAGADGQITKPFEAQALVERVKEFMNRPAPAPEPEPSPEVVSAEDDFFDPNITTLSPLEAAAIPSDAASDAPMAQADATTDPGVWDPSDTSASTLFGSPGEAADDDLDLDGGGMALGQTVVMDTPNTPSPGDATVAMIDADESMPDLDSDLGLGLGLDEPFALPEPISGSAADLESTLDSAPADQDATIIVGRDDVDASTSRDRLQPLDGPDQALEPAAETVAELPERMQDGGFDETPEAMPPVPEPAATVVNLDASLDEPRASMDSDSAEHDAVEPAAAGGAPIDLGPSSLAADDLDFGFDVSEQVSPDSLGDSMQDSFSSLMDISASDLPGLVGASGDSESASPDDALSASGPVELGAGYDVSSSDLVTAPPPEDTRTTKGVEISEPIPATGSPLEVPALPPRHAAEAAPAEEPTNEVPEVEDDAFALPTEVAPVSAIELPEPSAPAEEEIPVEDEIAIGTGLDEHIVEEEEQPAPEPTPTFFSDAGAPDADSKQVSDLSPLMEQRIQETLEKVAWEAFSDLSEAIVKQVLERVEQVAWEVIPQMAETLVREEIRKLKGEHD